jgi:6-phosphogluconate dehydrogenase (decarboxylating)
MPWPKERFAFGGCCVIVAPQTVKIESVSKVSTWQKVGVVARVAGKQAGRNRTIGAARRAIGTISRTFARVAHQLWLEVMGTVFLTMAAFGAFGFFREYAKFHTGQAGVGHLVAAVAFTLTF